MSPSPRMLAIASSIGAGVLWGAWAFWINRDSSQVYTSAFTQFVSSMIVTVLMSMVVLKTQPRFQTTPARVLGPAIISSSIAVGILVVSHLLARTENLLLTIAGPALVGFGYCLFYSYKMSNQSPG